MAFKNQEEVIEWYKSYSPSVTIGKTDQEIYGLASDWVNKRYGKTLIPYEVKVKPTSAQGIPITNMESDGNYLSEIPTSPDDISSLYGLSTRIGTASLSGFLAESGIAPKFFQKSYNESLAGQLYQLINGEPAYNIEDYESEDYNWLQEAGSYIVGMVSVLEAAAFMTGAKAGIFGAQKATSALHKFGMIGLKTSTKSKLKDRALTTAMIESGLETGITLGTVGAAHTSAADANQQLKENGSIDMSRTLSAGAWGFGESFLIGAPAGAVARGYMGSKYAMAKLADDGKALDMSTKALYGLPSRIGVEALAFATLPNIYRAGASPFGVDVFKDYPTIGSEEWNKLFLMDIATAGVMEGFQTKVREAQGYDDSYLWARQLLKQANKDVETLNKSSENIKNSFEESGINLNPEALELISNTNQNFSLSDAEYNLFKRNQDKLIEIGKKQKNKESLSSDDISFLQQNLLPNKLIELGLWQELRNNDATFRSILEESEGRAISDEEFDIYKATLRKKINDTNDSFADLNEAITGFRGERRVPVDSDAPAFKPVTLQRKRPVVEKGQSDTETKYVTTQEEMNQLMQENVNTIEEFQWKDITSRPSADVGDGPVVVQGNRALGVEDIAKATKKALQEEGVSIDYNANVDAARQLISELENDIYSYIDKGGNLKTKNNKKTINEIKNTMKDVKEGSGDRAAVISYGLSKRKLTGVNDQTYRKDNTRVDSQSKEAGKFVNWLHKNKNKTIKDVDFLDDLFPYIQETFYNKDGSVKGGANVSLSALSKFFEYADGKFIANGVGLRIQKSISFTDINKLIKNRNIEVNVKDLENVNQKIENVYNELNNELKGDNFNKAKSLIGLAKYGIRPEEINRITKNNIKQSKKEGYYIDFGREEGVPKIFKDKTFANAIPISDGLAKLILSIPTENNNSPIFYNFTNEGKIGSKKVLPYIAKKLFGVRPDGKDYAYNNSRQLLRVKYKDAEISKEDMDVYMRHESSTIELKYGKEDIDAQLRRHKDIQEKLGIGDADAKFQFDAVGRPESVSTLAPWLDEKIKQNPGLKIRKLQDSEFVGRFYEGVIDITMGKANKFTFFHENAHRLKAMIDSSGNKKLKNLWGQAEKLFRADAKKQKRDLEEFISDELATYSLKREQNASIKAKMRGWVDRMYTAIKQVFFGKDNLNKNDIKNILGEKVFKGFASKTNAKASSIARFKYSSIEEMSKAIKKDFDTTLKNSNVNLNVTEKKALIKYIAKSAGIENADTFKLGDPLTSEADLVAFNEKFKLLPYTEMRGISDMVEKASVIRNIDIAAPKVLTPTQQKNIMKMLGFKNKTLWGSDLKELKAYQEIVNSLRIPGQDRLASIMESSTIGELSDMMEKLDDVTLIAGVKAGTLPVGQILRKLGAKNIANNLEDHISVELRHVGEFVLFEETAQKIMGKANWEGRLGKGIKDSLYLIDLERYIERKESGKLKAYEDNFIKKAFKSDVIIKDENNKLIKNPKYKDFTTKNPEKSPIDFDTREGKVVKAWSEYTNYIYESFQDATRANLGEAEYANFKQNNKINWIKDNIYVSRLLTPEFKRKFNLRGHAYNKLVDQQAAPIAKDLAVEKYKTNNPSQEQIGSMWQDASDIVAQNLYDLFRFGKGRHQTRFLKKRHYKLPEEVEVDGKKIKVYETSYESTVKPYALGMSKFLANTEIFPEYVKLNNYDFPGQKAALEKLKAANPKWGTFIADQVEKQLGYGKNYTDYDDFFSKALSNTAQILAKTQLSFPTSGFKNLILGQTATMQAFRISEWWRAVGRSMSKEFRNEVKGLGATEIGLRHIEDLKFDFGRKGLDFIFKFGLMKPTENINRYISVAASRIEQDRFAQILRNKMSTKKQIEGAERKLKKFYSLNDEQIGLLKKYGMGGVDDVDFPSSFAKAKERRTVQNLYDKMDNMAHIKTQGASINFYMPKWADDGIYRPLTLFKRMAYAATVNTFNNASIAFKNGDYMKLAMTAVGPYLAGKSLIALYDLVYDEKPPVENSDEARYLTYVLMRGETLGVLSDFLRIYEGEGAESTIYPAVYNYFKLAWKNAVASPLANKHKNWEQVSQDVLKGTFGMYRGLSKLGDTSFNKKMKKYRDLYYEFHDETFPEKQEKYLGEKKLTRRSPYYRQLKESFYKQTSEEFTKHAIIMTYAVATDLYNENVTSDGTPTKYKNHDEAFKQAVSILKTKLKTLNPNPGNFLRKDKDTSVRWLKWLAKDPKKAEKYYKDLKEIEALYRLKIRDFYRILPRKVKSPEVLKMMQQEIKKLK